MIFFFFGGNLACWRLTSSFILQRRNEPLLGNKDRMYHYRKVEREVKGGYSEKCSLKKTSIKGTLELFLSYKEPHQAAAFEIHSQCSSSPALRSSGGKKRGGRKGGREGRHCDKLVERQFVWLVSSNSGSSHTEPHQKRPIKYHSHHIRGPRVYFPPQSKSSLIIDTKCILVHQLALGKT